MPITNARYALNAANARFGSLYDALYGTDAILAEASSAKGYDPARGAGVIAKVRAFLDETFPLADASWTDVTGFTVVDGQLVAATEAGAASLVDARTAGYGGDAGAPDMIVLRNHRPASSDQDRPQWQ